MLPSSFATFFAQAANTAAASSADASTPVSSGPPAWTTLVYMLVIVGAFYFVLIRPQQQAKKQQDEKIKAARTGDKVITTSGIHGLITNVKDTTIIVKIADNVKVEIEKTHIDKIVRSDSPESTEKPQPVTAKK